MISLIDEHLDEIKALCEEFGVVRLEIFGSAADDTFDPARSDIDFLVEYAPDADFGPWLGRYFELESRLESLLNRPVDLVMSGAPRNRFFIREMNKSRRLLYAA